MYSLLTLSFSSFLISVFLTPLAGDLYVRLGWVDRPDFGRKVHSRPMPRAGGVPIVIAYAGAFGVVFLLGLAGGHLIEPGTGLIWRMLPAGLVVFAIGLLDDIVGLHPWQKFAGQTGAALLAWWAGVQIHAVRGVPLNGWIAVSVTVVWLVACTNAFNLIDGLDGLATGIGLCAALTAFIAALLYNEMGLAMATAPLAGALLGFLCYNFSPASIFLGDSGSLTVGFLLGCFGIVWSQKSATLLGMTAPVLVLTIPLLDTALAILRRFLRHQPIFGADRGHIHHRLLDRGFTTRRVVFLLYGFSGLAAVLSLLMSLLHNRFSGLILIVSCGAIVLGISRLGYVELDEARRIIMGGVFRRVLNARLSVRKLDTRLQSSADPDDSWSAIVETSRDLGFSHALLRLNSSIYRDQLSCADPEQCWSLRVPLGPSRYAQFEIPFDRSLQPAALAPFATTLRRHLTDTEPSGSYLTQQAAPPVGDPTS